MNNNITRRDYEISVRQDCTISELYSAMSITEKDFVNACEALEGRWEQFGGETDWLNVKLHDQVQLQTLQQTSNV
jgi:hypothetical protein